MARIDGMREPHHRHHGMSQDLHVPGCRVGWAPSALPNPAQSIRRSTTFSPSAPPRPLQQAGALELNRRILLDKPRHYATKRERLLKSLTRSSFTVYKPRRLLLCRHLCSSISPKPSIRPRIPRDVSCDQSLVEQSAFPASPAPASKTTPSKRRVPCPLSPSAKNNKP